MKKLHFILLVAFALFATNTTANVTLNSIFTDHMVLQRNNPNLVWGWANPGEKISVTFKTQKHAAIADANGAWKVKLKPEPAGGPFTMTVKGNNEIVLNDILIGEVWICSGQSNMDFTLIAIGNEAEAKSANNPNIRQVIIPKATAYTPFETTEPTKWAVCNPGNAGLYSATGYFFAKKLYKELNVPIGLIKSAWGGTNIETWISNPSIKTHPDFTEVISGSPASVEKRIQSEVNKRIKLISDFQQGNLGATDVQKWKNEKYDDSGWQTIYAPKFWEEQGLKNFDGVVWYRKEINLTKEQAEHADVISLGKVDDIDDTYINGQFIGRMIDYRTIRRYDVPKNVLKAGRNQIAMRVEDGAGGGGIYGEKEDMYLKFNNGLPALPLSGDWKVRVDTAGIQKSVQLPNSYPSLLFNAMIHPLLNYGVKGVIWYQGETNAWAAKQYESVFPLLIKDWRKQFNKPKLPFYYVQLASYNANDSNSVHGSAWAELREAQRFTLSVPRTGMVVATDIGDAKDIHPKDKESVGNRLAFHALKNDYGKKVANNGPLYKSVKFKNGKAYLTFTFKGSGLKIRKGESELKGFLIAGADQKFRWAEAAIVGNKVMVWQAEVPNPVAVRYAWTDVNDYANLYNSDGLPASPFRTDNWKLITEKNKYVIAK